uniref:Uncharacterized protein LOC114343514 n=1 Tax=Diabrotica virgifera virgifera TaxID=50390 RepID=A0A6P7H246_DIAVI
MICLQQIDSREPHASRYLRNPIPNSFPVPILLRASEERQPRAHLRKHTKEDNQSGRVQALDSLASQCSEQTSIKRAFSVTGEDRIIFYFVIFNFDLYIKILNIYD